MAPRFVREDLEIGVHVPKGSTLLLASANLDEAAFADAGRLDITRSPNRRVGFGFGAHHCLGALLACVVDAVPGRGPRSWVRAGGPRRRRRTCGTP